MTTISKTTLQFLSNLNDNNNRDWFQDNKERYESAKDNVKDFLQEILDKMKKTDHIEKMKVFRIYRDIRFSKDKTPYKTNFGASFTRATALLRGGYYLHIQPGNSFIGGGFWNPNPEDLKRIRQEIEFDDAALRKIIASNTFKSYFGDLKGDEVKTAPRGFDKDHPAIDLIKKKQYLVMHPIKDVEVVSEDFAPKVVATFVAMRPFFDYMSEVLTTNMNGERIV